MTDPQPAQAQAEIHLQVATAVVTGPDGQPWVALTLQYGLSVHQLLLPETLALKAGPALAEKLIEGAAQARRVRSGLILPGNGMPPPGQGPLPHLPGMPG
jgi:hypothetical protein